MIAVDALDVERNAASHFVLWLDRLSVLADSPIAYRRERTIGFRQGKARVLDWLDV